MVPKTPRRGALCCSVQGAIVSRSSHRSTALPADMFHRSRMTSETTLTAAEYRALLQAASAKGKLEAFYKWQRNRKIILKG